MGVFGKSPGRSPGVRNRLSHAFLTDFLADWQAGGPAAIKTVRMRDPSTYLRVAASILPKEMLVEATLNDMSDPGLDDLIEAVQKHLLERPNEPMKLIGSANGATINGSAAATVIENARARESDQTATRRRE